MNTCQFYLFVFQIRRHFMLSKYLNVNQIHNRQVLITGEVRVNRPHGPFLTRREMDVKHRVRLLPEKLHTLKKMLRKNSVGCSAIA